jgi:hypothetical protein
LEYRGDTSEPWFEWHMAPEAILPNFHGKESCYRIKPEKKEAFDVYARAYSHAACVSHKERLNKGLKAIIEAYKAGELKDF